MDNRATTIEMLFEKAEVYTRTTVELAKMNAIDKSADVLSSLLSRLTVIIVVAMFALLLNIGLSLWIGELLGKTYYGYFAVAGAYFILAIVINSFKDEWIKLPVSNFIIIKMLKKK
ncbi:hypothetical protein H4V97_000630 [Flavobacterium sp. CG_23.5]|uniref:hypothetical protein n=1 Tax=unclassified Flavobacterium TaxID=196869 RepID=UPI0018C94F44|nr:MULTISPECIES: hypothetical protein [unclassified Flavobacterium]MBG6111595.1 hypothetical protein [Flavobacterium sp. CG_9.10]MBP2282312.1 hypothetical protein [Flavobacterium sp. CG_23.5]